MKLYIRATGNISPQNSFGHPPLLQEIVVQAGNRLTCKEPDYTKLIDVKLIRRMSRVIKMGVASAMDCLQEAQVKNPDAIITGTAYGCLEDTGVFLKKMIAQNEEMLTPTAFIQSTHNTVGAQIALMLQCHNYNNTFVHRGFSFESAVRDAQMLIAENPGTNALVGSVDEITHASHAILSRFGIYKAELDSNMNLFEDESKGTIAGEGAAFFLLTDSPSGNDYALLTAMDTLYKPAADEDVILWIEKTLAASGVEPSSIDLFITGRNGEPVSDKIYDSVLKKFSAANTSNYKHLCGEYPTSTSFALWMASSLIRDGKQKSILIYNHYLGIHHSLFLLTAC
ncbi:MAG: beta-ketoacyl synthase chain length factor [Gemmatimonadaceae bacterium]|nr:beta-ketoacyl synthase chain length factor [Chitinophagaceae bacterium]